MLGLVVACVLLFAACGGDDSPAAPDTPDTWPLTGLPVADGASANQPVLAVKVDNTANAEPQVGLSSADLIVEELVEGGLTRLVAMYHSSLPPQIGPVRSVRTTDLGIVAPTGGALAASGGAAHVLDDLADAGLTVLTEGTPGFSRAGDRPAPYNVMLDPAAAIAGLDLSAPAQLYLPWGQAPTAGATASEVEATFSPTHTTRWTWADDGWHRDGELAAAGEEFKATTILILRAPTRDAGYRDPGGNPVPETILEGTGEATMATAGQVVEGTWSKSSPEAALELSDEAGQPLEVPPGRTWIELIGIQD